MGNPINVHGDLHPKNILLHQNTIKLADFGCSRLHGSKCYTKPRGIIPYIDPKIPNAEEQSHFSYVRHSRWVKHEWLMLASQTTKTERREVISKLKSIDHIDSGNNNGLNSLNSNERKQ
ncbi:kinase-like domain-containing protein [Rhizophagus clarus]|uniref:Kinase-like domain-containing protein n=1 Tax=Rhizophagus clarus TaxID=94130 RepID=A0A8H3KXI7_9GLOM|nr:kinase-like domain-containing protein [Rhizophagus clarus]